MASVKLARRVDYKLRLKRPLDGHPSLGAEVRRGYLELVGQKMSKRLKNARSDLIWLSRKLIRFFLVFCPPTLSRKQNVSSFSLSLPLPTHPARPPPR